MGDSPKTAVPPVYVPPSYSLDPKGSLDVHRAKMPVSPYLLQKLLTLPADVSIVGAEMRNEFGNPTLYFNLEGTSIPKDAVEVDASFETVHSEAVRFTGFTKR